MLKLVSLFSLIFMDRRLFFASFRVCREQHWGGCSTPTVADLSPLVFSSSG
jgi:hypothetical protein